MSSPAREEADEAAAPAAHDEIWDYVPLIHEAMDERDIKQRKLALKTGISKTRLALLLHHDRSKRARMSLVEFHIILRALDIDIHHAIICVDALRDRGLLREERYATLIAMLGELFKDLPRQLIIALEEIEGIDGSEVRREWAKPLQAAVIAKLVKEICAVLKRRALFGEDDPFAM